MNDVWNEIVRELEQKAMNLTQIEYELNRLYDKTEKIEQLEEVDKEFRKIKWVRLEDVLSAIKQIKQDYVLVSKEKLENLPKSCEECDSFCLGEYHCTEFRCRYYDKIMELLKKNDSV